MSSKSKYSDNKEHKEHKDVKMAYIDGVSFKLPKGMDQETFNEINKSLDRRIKKYCLNEDSDEESDDTKFFNIEMKKIEKKQIAEKKAFFGKYYGTKLGRNTDEESTDDGEEEPKERLNEPEFTAEDAAIFAKEMATYFSESKYIDPSILKKFKAVRDRYEKVKTIDQELALNIRKMFNETSLRDTDEYEELQKALRESDIILHFKDADTLARLDMKDPLGFLINMVEQKDKFREGKDFYEIIKKDGPQKIMIICSGKLGNKYKLIRKYIQNYMKDKGCPVERRDIKCLKNNQTGNIEILISPYYVKNSEDRDAFVASLKKYIREIDGDEKVIKMLDKKEMDSTCSKDTKSNLLPYQKQYANGNPIDYKTTNGMIDLIVSAINKECKELKINPDGKIVININQTINNVGRDMNVNNSTNIVVIADPYDKLLSDLIEQKPKWYIPNKYLSKNDVYKWCTHLMSNPPSKNAFWPKMKNKIIQDEKRTGRGSDRSFQIKLKKLWE